MESNEIKNQMSKQGYRFVGDHGAVKICRWTKKSLRDEGVCYKEKFYGIKSHLCCQMTPWLGCPNHCLHCWRAVELDFEKIIDKNKVKSPKQIIDGCMEAQKKLLEGFNIDEKSEKKQLSKANQEKYKEALEPMQFAISLSGEPLVYDMIGGIVEELRKRKKTSFIVTNGLYPEKVKELSKNNQLPTQFYVSVNVPRKEMYQKFHRSCLPGAWEKLMETLDIFSELTCRTVFRMNLIKDLNMKEEFIEDYVELIKKANPKFIELKGFMSVGFARERLGYDRMPSYEEMKEFAEKLVCALGEDDKILDTHEFSRAFVIGKDEGELKISSI
jgi:tRNA wybutosine-synthesizing protein 1